MATVLVVIVAFFFLAMGIVGIVRPLGIIKYFGMTVVTPDMRNEVRAVYGGFGVAVAALLAAALTLDNIREGVLVTIAVAMAGMAAGRILSFAIERTEGLYPALFCAIEIALAAMLLTAAYLV